MTILANTEAIASTHTEVTTTNDMEVTLAANTEASTRALTKPLVHTD